MLAETPLSLSSSSSLSSFTLSTLYSFDIVCIISLFLSIFSSSLSLSLSNTFSRTLKHSFEGIQPHSSTHPCFVCSGSRLDSNGNKSAKEGRWKKGQLRTLDFNSKNHKKWREDTKAKGDSPQVARGNLSKYFNCHVEPMELSSDRHKPIFLICPFDPLHVNKVTITSDFHITFFEYSMA